MGLYKIVNSFSRNKIHGIAFYKYNVTIYIISNSFFSFAFLEIADFY